MIKNYYRLAKPGIIYGNLLSTIGGFLLASYGNIDTMLFLATVLGAGLIIGSGCVFNNYLDRDIDSKMDRTRKRSIVNGEIPGINALLYGAILGLIGSALLLIFVNTLTFLVGLVGFIWYVFVYYYAKRKTHYSTLIGTLAGSTPPVAGYVAVTNSLDGASLILFLILTFWQMSHFYSIAIFRYKEYAKAKIPLLSITHGTERTKREIAIYAMLFSISAPMLTVFGYAGFSYALIMILFSLVWLKNIADGYNSGDDKKWAGKVFGQSLVVLLAFCVALSLNAYLP